MEIEETIKKCKKNNEQRIIIDNDLKAHIISNSPHILGDSKENLEGDFLISSEDVAKIIPMINKDRVTLIEIYRGALCNIYEFGKDSCEKNILSELDDLNKRYNERCQIGEKRYDLCLRYLNHIENLLRFFNKIPKFIKRIFLTKKERGTIKQYENEQ